MSIKNFTLYGERHSGTTWITSVISETFSLPYINIYDDKHFFGFCDWDTLKLAKNTLFICVVRNIYSWISGMTKSPYYLQHNNICNIKPWKSFISNKEIIYDKNWLNNKYYYDDVFDMRHHKILFQYCYLPFIVDNYIFIRYEEFIVNYPIIINDISKKYNLNINSKIIINSDKSKLNIEIYKKSFDIINLNTLWLTEKMIGYKKIDEYKNLNSLNILDKTVSLR